jgi:glycosyltransferase involved in cell wall biosynthesis
VSRPASPSPLAAPSPAEEAAGRTVAPPARSARPRLLLLTLDFEPGGPGQRIATGAPYLAREGFEVSVACLKGWGGVGDDLEAAGVRAIALGARSALDPRAAGRLLSILRRDRVQILHAHLSRPAVTARILGRIARVPVLVTSRPEAEPGAGSWPRLLERLTAPLSDAVLASSEAVRREALRSGGLSPGLVRALSEGVAVPEAPPDPERRARRRRDLGTAPGELLVGTTAAPAAPRKGLDIFLAAAGLLAREIPQARFVVFGESAGDGRLESRAAQEGVSHRTVFAGPQRDLGEALAVLDLFVLPVIGEGGGLALLQAMAAAVPVVAGHATVAPEALEDGQSGLLVPPGDPAALARSCADLLRNRERAARMGAAGRARVEASFRVEDRVRDLAAIYRELLGTALGSGGANPPGRPA